MSYTTLPASSFSEPYSKPPWSEAMITLLENEFDSSKSSRSTSTFDEGLSSLITKTLNLTNSSQLAMFWTNYLSTIRQNDLPVSFRAVLNHTSKRKLSGEWTTTQVSGSNPKLSATPETKHEGEVTESSSGEKKNISEILSLRDHSTHMVDELPHVARENASPCKLFAKKRLGYDLWTSMNPKLSSRVPVPEKEQNELDVASSGCSRSEFLLQLVQPKLVCLQKKLESVPHVKPDSSRKPMTPTNNQEGPQLKHQKSELNSKVLDFKTRRPDYLKVGPGIRGQRATNMLRKVVLQKSLTQNFGQSQANTSSMDLVHDRFDDPFECYDDLALFDAYDQQAQENSNMTMYQTVPIEPPRTFSAKKVASSENKENYTPLKYAHRPAQKLASGASSEKNPFSQCPQNNESRITPLPQIPAGLFANNLNLNKDTNLATPSPIKKKAAQAQGTVFGACLKNIQGDSDVLAWATPKKETCKSSAKKSRRPSVGHHDTENEDPALSRLPQNHCNWPRSVASTLKNPFQE